MVGACTTVRRRFHHFTVSTVFISRNDHFMFAFPVFKIVCCSPVCCGLDIDAWVSAGTQPTSMMPCVLNFMRPSCFTPQQGSSYISRCWFANLRFLFWSPSQNCVARLAPQTCLISNLLRLWKKRLSGLKQLQSFRQDKYSKVQVVHLHSAVLKYTVLFGLRLCWMQHCKTACRTDLVKTGLPDSPAFAG